MAATKSNGRILQNMLRAYDFYAANPMATARDLADELGIPTTTARSRTRSLQDRGAVIRHVGIAISHQHPDQFMVVEGKRPLELTPRLKQSSVDDMPVARDCNRIITKAKQLGIPRDPMIAALFGPAVAA